MVDVGDIHTGDIGTDLELIVEDTNSTGTANSVLDLSAADDFFMIITDTDGTETELDAEILNSPGTDGIITANSGSPSIWSSAGEWKKRAKIVYGSGNKYESNDYPFEVI